MTTPGTLAVDALSQTVQRFVNIAAVKLVTYVEPEPLQQRVMLSSDERAIVSAALDTRAQRHLPFWDSVMMCTVAAQSVPSQLLDQVQFHRSFRGEEIELSREDVLRGEVRRLADSLSRDTGLALISEVQCRDGTARHMPLLDFHCPAGTHGEALAGAVLERVMPSEFVLLTTGRSYHGWGMSLLSTDALIDLLSRALFFSPLVDRAYVAHQLLERRCALRISAGPSQKRAPMVIRIGTRRRGSFSDTEFGAS